MRLLNKPITIVIVSILILATSGILFFVDIRKQYDVWADLKKQEEKYQKLLDSIENPAMSKEEIEAALINQTAMEVDVPNDWLQYSNEYFAFNYPDKYIVEDKEFEKSNYVGIYEPDEYSQYQKDMAEYLNSNPRPASSPILKSSIILMAIKSEIEFEIESINKTFFETYYGKEGVMLLKDGYYTINYVPVYLKYLDFQSPYISTVFHGPSREYTVLVKGEGVTYILQATSYLPDKWDDLQLEVERIASTLVTNTPIDTNPKEKPLGQRKFCL